MRRALAAIIVTIATPSFATDLAAARKLFEEGIKREEASDWSGALEKFREVAKIRTNHIVHFHVALCLEKTGKLVDALSEFSLAKSGAESEGGTDAELTITKATKHIDALRARVPALLVKRPAMTSSLTIDGVAALFEAVTPFDPGEHVIEVRAEEHRTFAVRVTLVEGVREPVVVVPMLPRIERIRPPTVRWNEPAVAPQPNRTAVYVTAGLSLVSLGAAGVFYGLRASTLAELDGSCDASGCDPSKRSLDDRGRTYTIAGNVLLGVGVASAATAVVLLVLEPRNRTTVAVGAGTIHISTTF